MNVIVACGIDVDHIQAFEQVPTSLPMNLFAVVEKRRKT